jgi:hypothetical protein
MGKSGVDGSTGRSIVSRSLTQGFDAAAFHQPPDLPLLETFDR